MGKLCATGEKNLGTGCENVPHQFVLRNTGYNSTCLCGRLTALWHYINFVLLLLLLCLWQLEQTLHQPQNTLLTLARYLQLIFFHPNTRGTLYKFFRQALLAKTTKQRHLCYAVITILTSISRKQLYNYSKSEAAQKYYKTSNYKWKYQWRAIE